MTIEESDQTRTVRLLLPFQLQTLARCGAEVKISLQPHITQRRILQALEQAYPMLLCRMVSHQGTMNSSSSEPLPAVRPARAPR